MSRSGSWHSAVRRQRSTGSHGHHGGSGRLREAERRLEVECDMCSLCGRFPLAVPRTVNVFKSGERA